ncbi:hypothetical protein SEMRO_908_G218831.1 [Seminavis robusta]|uniref:Reverse transcriptase domain-containing protein n=1 Tax=Seminavis robusta TaxID=568900 RepID=A0A9N8EB15_9STRA|nr:hypothetical protein SEMRO_908_G218831.1 [Seminavis robusta]|eukprot:Sro908_g218831.1  (202) ;mRNA; f:9082-9687
MHTPIKDPFQLLGTVQGSNNSPLYWLIWSCTLLDQHEVPNSTIAAFVDDALISNHSFNDANFLPISTLRKCSLHYRSLLSQSDKRSTHVCAVNTCIGGFDCHVITPPMLSRFVRVRLPGGPLDMKQPERIDQVIEASGMQNCSPKVYQESAFGLDRPIMSNTSAIIACSEDRISLMDDPQPVEFGTVGQTVILCLGCSQTH